VSEPRTDPEEDTTRRDRRPSPSLVELVGVGSISLGALFYLTGQVYFEVLLSRLGFAYSPLELTTNQIVAQGYIVIITRYPGLLLVYCLLLIVVIVAVHLVLLAAWDRAEQAVNYAERSRPLRLLALAAQAILPLMVVVVATFSPFLFGREVANDHFVFYSASVAKGCCSQYALPDRTVVGRAILADSNHVVLMTNEANLLVRSDDLRSARPIVSPKKAR